MDTQSLQSALLINRPRDYIRGEDVCAVGIRVAQEVGEGHGWEGIVVGIGGLEEFHHCGRWNKGICGILVIKANGDDRVLVVRGSGEIMQSGQKMEQTGSVEYSSLRRFTVLGRILG